MARFCTLFSGSSGNSTYLGGSDTALLVDAGRSCKQLVAALGERGIDPKALAGVLLTHEHTDHISGLRVFLKKYHTPLFASPEVLARLMWEEILPPAHPVREVVAGERFAIGSLEVEAFDTPHDSAHSFGYRVHTPDGCDMAVATDLGYISEEVLSRLEGCQLVLLESNYSPEMLSVSSYPYHLKRRIASGTGHLSNEDCAAGLVHLVRHGGTRFVLGHLSEQNNLPELARQTALSALTMAGMREGIDFSLAVAPRFVPGELVTL